MLQTQQRQFVVVPELLQEALMDSVIYSYESICDFDHNPIVPNDTLMMDHLSATFYEVASYHEFADQFFYRTLSNEDRQTFINTAVTDYYARFWTDILLLAQRQHLHMYVHKLGQHINQPVKGVW